MKYYRFPENRITKIGFAAFLFAVLILCRDTLVTSSIIGFYKATFISYGLIAIVGIAFLWVNRKNLKQILTDERMLLALVATVIFVVPMLVKQDWQMMYVSILICIYFSIFLSYFVTLEEVARCYVAILSIIGVYSCLATYLLDTLAEMNILRAPIFSNGIFDFYNFGISYTLIAAFTYYRNFGIFREPGVYQYFIILGLILNNYSVKWDKSWKMWACNFALIATMLSTFATGGIIELGLLLIVLFIDQKWYKNKTVCIVALVLAIILAAVVIYSFEVENMLYTTIWNMVYKMFNNTQTTKDATRLNSVFTDLDIFLHNPIFGAKLADVIYAVEFNTTSTMVLFAAFGFLCGGFHVLTWVALLWSRDRNIVVNFMLLLIMFMSFNTQNLSANTFFWLLPVLALAERVLPEIKLLCNKKV